MTWAKIDTGFFTGPKIELAGPYAALVYLHVILLNAEKGADGELPALCVNVDYLARRLQLPIDKVEEGMKRCVTLHLLHVTGDVVSICGWDEEWRVATSKDRVRKHRAKKKRALNSDVTPGNVTDVSCNGVTPREIDRESREIEEIYSKGVPGEDAGQGKPKARPRKRGPDPAVITETAKTVVAAFNNCMARNLGSKGSEGQIKSLLARGYTEPQMRAVMWWAGEEWAADEEMRMRVSPTTMLKLTSSHGNRTFPQYLELATELWRDQRNESPPWEVTQ